MKQPIISVENLSKAFLIGLSEERGTASNQTHLREVIARVARNSAIKAATLLGRRPRSQRQDSEDYWALKNVSFSVDEGEVLGIIGRNGAGKSTLLKILSRITEPTGGRVTLRGRVASLLEVGTGFHLELTGRENIFMNGAILGMSRAEIRKKFDEIVAFAEVERFLDTPVKRYSSGMYVRLAFAVAAHLEPEILIVDEVLAVGDAGFQKKCLGKMNEVSHQNGRTVLFVSHNMGVVTSLCQNAIWLENGQVHERGPAREVVSRYMAAGTVGDDRFIHLVASPRDARLDDDRLRLQSLEWLSGTPLMHGELVRARITFRTRAPVQAASVGIGFSNLDGTRLLCYDTDFQDGTRPDIYEAGVHSAEITISTLPLGPDVYSLDVGSRSGDFHGLDYVGDCSRIEVIAGPRTPGTIVQKGSAVRLLSEWSWDLAKADRQAVSANV